MREGGRGPVCEQTDLGHQSDTVSPEQNNQNSTTTRKRKNSKWSKEENIFIIQCYFRCNQSRLGYRERMLKQWNSKGLFFITEQRLVYLANNIRTRSWLTEIELEEIKKKIELDNGNMNDTDTDNVTLQETNTTTMSKEEPFIEQVDETPNENQHA